MKSFKLGNDVYLEFVVKVNRRPALIIQVSGELYRNGEYLRPFTATNSGSRVSGIIKSDAFTTIGDYDAKFGVSIDGMGKKEYAMPFKITESVLGKRRQ